MGLLDDAIREHLDLKRRRGADPGDVERAEQEALGPVRRDPFEHAEDEPEGAFEDNGPAPAYDQDAELEYEEGPVRAATSADEEPFLAEEPLAEDGRFVEEEPFAEDERFVEKEPFAEPDPLAPEPSVPAPHPADLEAGDETVEYDVEETFAAERDEAPPGEEEQPHHGDEDVLEETPEFLQDAPEHDRLWFEQRPPKDFDFDD